MTLSANAGASQLPYRCLGARACRPATWGPPGKLAVMSEEAARALYEALIERDSQRIASALSPAAELHSPVADGLRIRGRQRVVHASLIVYAPANGDPNLAALFGGRRRWVAVEDIPQAHRQKYARPETCHRRRSPATRNVAAELSVGYDY